LLRLFEHLQRRIFSVAQVQSGDRTASEGGPLVMNLVSTLPSDTAFRMREANSIWIAPRMIPWAGEISK
jgi:hypothetical protein